MYSTIINIYVVVNFLSQVIFIFLLFQLHQYTFLYPKTKEKQKLPLDKKINYLQPNYYKVYHTISSLEAKKI